MDNFGPLVGWEMYFPVLVPLLVFEGVENGGEEGRRGSKALTGVLLGFM